MLAWPLYPANCSPIHPSQSNVKIIGHFAAAAPAILLIMYILLICTLCMCTFAEERGSFACNFVGFRNEASTYAVTFPLLIGMSVPHSIYLPTCLFIRGIQRGEMRGSFLTFF